MEEKTPAGTPRWRVRVEGQKKKRISLPQGVGPKHPRFKDFYEAARQGVKLELKAEAKVARGTLDELCGRFLEWMETQVEAGNLSQLTLNSRRTGLTQARDCKTPNGKRRMGELKADLPHEAFGHIRNSFGTRTGAAHTCLKVLRAAYTWGADHGTRRTAPSSE